MGGFQRSLLQRHPGKPPSVIGNTWKNLSMSSMGGSYHAYLTEFNRQKALISTGPDGVLETFLAGLTATLREQVEYCQNRLWKSDEFDKLVQITTERVNSVSVNQTTSSKRRTDLDTQTRGSGSRRTDSRKRSMSAGPKPKPNHSTPHQGKPSNRKSYIGKTADESMAISEYCHANGLCKFCRATDHAHYNCKQKDSPPPFQHPANWNEKFWLDRNMDSAARRGKPNPKRSKN